MRATLCRLINHIKQESVIPKKVNWESVSFVKFSLIFSCISRDSQIKDFFSMFMYYKTLHQYFFILFIYFKRLSINISLLFIYFKRLFIHPDFSNLFMYFKRLFINISLICSHISRDCINISLFYLYISRVQYFFILFIYFKSSIFLYLVYVFQETIHPDFFNLFTYFKRPSINISLILAIEDGKYS